MVTSRPSRVRRTSVTGDLAGRTALVTGASSGIGEQFARELALRGAHVVLTARSAGRLEALAGELAGHPGGVTVLPADLSDPAAPAELVAALGRPVDLLVNNAGFGTHNVVVDEDPEVLAREVQLNCASLVGLTVRLLPGMVARGRGGVINVSSTAGFQPVATMAVYAATKAFVLSFSEALWAETRGTGVRVLTLCPGGTETRFFEATGKEFLTRGRQTAAEVVEVALHAYFGGRGPTVVSGTRNRLMANGYRVIPRALMARFSAGTVRT